MEDIDADADQQAAVSLLRRRFPEAAIARRGRTLILTMKTPPEAHPRRADVVLEF